jgi:hypothetical protein
MQYRETSSPICMLHMQGVGGSHSISDRFHGSKPMVLSGGPVFLAAQGIAYDRLRDIL